MNGLIAITKHSIIITAFVAVMMLVIEYTNVLTQGQWQEHIRKRPWGQYVLAAFLGSTPGCLGAFAVVAMYSHRSLSLGAVVAAMIATSGDESFVMFAMFPQTALMLTGILFVVGVISGALTDKLLGRHLTSALFCESGFAVHIPEQCQCFSRKMVVVQWKNCTAMRGMLFGSLALFVLSLITGQIGPEQWNWIKISLMLVSLVALFIVATVPDHFLEKHLWDHVVRGHVARVFMWTFGALLILHFVVDQWNLANLIKQGRWVVLGISALIGIIPESGPHLIFVTMFAKGIVPFSVLLTSSIVQDGHGMLPMLAHSRRAFIVIKLINLIVGLALGAILMAFGK